MKKLNLLLIFVGLINLIIYANNNPNKLNQEAFNNKVNSGGIAFTENKGQVHDQNFHPRPEVLYGTMAGNMAVHIKKSGISYQLNRVDKFKDVEDIITKETRKEIEQQTIYRLDLNWLNANSNFVTSQDEELPGYNNYYLESCPNGALNVKSYTGVTLHNLYNGINLHYYEKAGNLKYDYIVAPNGNYKQIQIQVEGAGITINKNGSLTLTTPFGDINEGEPIVYQNGKELNAKWVIKEDAKGSQTISFEVENYNPNIELVIDPVVRAWGSYYGGNGSDRGFSSAADGNGNIYLTGETDSNSGTFIATSGSHQSTFGGASADAFLVKFNPAGIRQWGNYYGGAGTDFGRSCALDINGNVYMAGVTYTSSGISIATSGSHQSFYGGGFSDAFLVKFNSNGIRQWGTFYGGMGNDVGYSCSIDATGNVYLVGWTTSTTSIANSGSHQSTNGLGENAFLVKFNSSGIRQWGTYYGGSGARGYSCSTDANNNVFITGHTSTSFGNSIATLGSHQSTIGAAVDAFLAKFDSLGIRQWGTYYGGAGDDYGYSCATDGNGNVYISGSTGSNLGTIIATSGSHQSISGGSTEAFLVKFNSSGIRQWGTYYGGIGAEQGYSCATDINDNIYIVGYTGSSAGTSSGTSIATPSSHQDTYGGGTGDAFLVKFNSNGIRQWGTYYGGNGTELVRGLSCTKNGSNDIYIAGETNTNINTSIASSGSHQSTNGGNYDAFIVKFNDNSSGITNQNKKLHNISLYPNPNNGQFTIDINKVNNSYITISNMLGQTIKIQKAELTNEININGFDGGIYFVSVIENNQTIYRSKIIKE